jgi:hypothetical protein
MLFWTCCIKAQKNISPEKLSDKQTAMQVKQLSLNKDQADKLKSINLKFAQKMLELRQKGQLKENREVLKNLTVSQNKEVEAILNDEQYQKYLSLKQQNRKRLRKIVKEKRSYAKQSQRENIAKLDLNKEQVEQMKSIKTKYTQQKRELRQNRGNETMQQLKSINENQDAEVKAVLSDEQFQTYLEMMKEQRERFNQKMQNRRLSKQ